MQFAIDPPIDIKITRMKQRVRWQDPLLGQRGIDQTSLVLDDGRDDNLEFSFMVLGDSGSGPHRGHDPQRRVAEQMLPHRDSCRFILHTGDVIYSVGSSEFYPQNFIAPYREFLVNGDQHRRIAYDRMVFNLPFLPVPGNHDYYDLPVVYGLLSQLTAPLRYLLQSQLDLDVGWHGSNQGNDYAHAFLDYLKTVNSPELERHLDQHYTAKTETGRCLRYQPGKFTRLPNRYYTFRVGGIDFFALDSNTINAPEPLPETAEGDRDRQQLRQQQAALDAQMQEINATAVTLNPKNPDHAEQLDDLNAKLQQLSEVQKDIEKQLTCDAATVTDLEQLEWLEQRLIASWQSPDVRGRVIYFHHPPYVTEATKWHQAQTLAVRQRLRRVLDGVAIALGQRDDRPIVDLVLSGHAHCFEYLRTLDTGYADAHTNWIICGGSGYSLRRQRQEGTDLCEGLSDLKLCEGKTIARSMQFVGRSGQGFQKRRPYSFLRIDVKPGTPPQFVVRPFVSEWYQRSWKDYAIEPFVLK